MLEPTTGRRRRNASVVAIDSLQPSGSTNAEAGLRLGYELAAETLREGGINRVILASDGVANVGATDPTSILARIRRTPSQGIQLVTVGFGMGNYNDVLMEQLADKGDGFYAYVNTLDDARTPVRRAADLDARDRGARRARRRSSSTPMSSRRTGSSATRTGPRRRGVPRRQVDAGAIGAGHAATALYALRLTGRGGGLFDAGRDRDGLDPLDRSRQSSRAGESTTPTSTASRSTFADTEPTFKLDAIVAAAAERFRASRWADGYDLTDVAALADEVGRPAGDRPGPRAAVHARPGRAVWNADLICRLSTALGPAGVVEERCRPADGAPLQERPSRPATRRGARRAERGGGRAGGGTRRAVSPVDWFIRIRSRHARTGARGCRPQIDGRRRPGGWGRRRGGRSRSGVSS